MTSWNSLLLTTGFMLAAQACAAPADGSAAGDETMVASPSTPQAYPTMNRPTGTAAAQGTAPADTTGTTDTTPTSTAPIGATRALWGAMGPSPADIEQGRTNDCWYLASLGALALENPMALERLFVVSPAGDTVTMTLVDPTSGAPQAITVPWPALDPNFANQVEGHAWVNVAEHALATLAARDNQPGALEGGTGQLAFELLSGQPGTDLQVAASLSTAWTAISAANQGTPVAVGTIRNAALGSLLPPDNVLSSHMYTVLGTETLNGVKIVHLRDPYGPYGPPTKNTDGSTSNTTDGEVTITFTDFTRAFTDVFSQ